MGGFWTKRATRAAVGFLLVLLCLTFAGAVHLVRAAAQRAANLDELARQANLSGIPASAEFLGWEAPQNAEDNAWPLYEGLSSVLRTTTRNRGFDLLTAYVLLDPVGPSPIPIDPDLADALVEASRKPTCWFPVEWHRNRFWPYRLMVNQCLFLATSSVDAMARGDLAGAKDRALASARIAAHAGQGVLRESAWARGRCEQLALKAGARVAARLPEQEALPFLEDLRKALGPEPTIVQALRGELVRIQARIDRTHLLPFGQKAPFEEVVKAAWKSQVIERYQELSRALANSTSEEEQRKRLRELDDWTRKNVLLQRNLPRQLERTGVGVSFTLARRRMLDGLIAWKRNGSPPGAEIARDPFGGGAFVPSASGYGLKSLGLDGVEQHPGEFWEQEGPQDDPVLLLASDPPKPTDAPQPMANSAKGEGSRLE